MTTPSQIQTARVPKSAASPGRPVRLSRIPPSPGAVRSYTTVAPRGRFVVDCLTRARQTTRDGWCVTDRATGARQSCWNLRDCLDLVRQLIAPPRANESRFTALRLDTPTLFGRDCVLYDRVTGQWWERSSAQLADDTAVLESLLPSLPGWYGKRHMVTYRPAGTPGS